MKIPEDIVADWLQFVDECCIGTPPAQNPADVQQAFSALRRLWPEKLLAIEAIAQSGLSIIAPLVTLGLVLADCENLEGFVPVFRRLRAGEMSAEAELTVAAVLVRLAYAPTLEPPLGPNVLDSAVTVSGRRVYIEVISPNTSDDIQAMKKNIFQLATTLVANSVGTHTELLLVGDHDAPLELIVPAIASAPIDGSIYELAGIGQVRRESISPGSVPDISGKILNSRPGPVLANARVRIEQGIRTSATVRVPVTDKRAHRLLSAELHHFSRSEANLLVVELTSVPGGLGDWVQLVQRWFQPNRNTRIGAVAFYDEALDGSPLTSTQRWRIVPNPFALVALPDALIAAFKSLDEGHMSLGNPA